MSPPLTAMAPLQFRSPITVPALPSLSRSGSFIPLSAMARKTAPDWDWQWCRRLFKIMAARLWWNALPRAERSSGLRCPAAQMRFGARARPVRMCILLYLQSGMLSFRIRFRIRAPRARFLFRQVPGLGGVGGRCEESQDFCGSRGLACGFHVVELVWPRAGKRSLSGYG